MPLAPLAGMETFVQDLRYAFRAFVKAPGFTAIALLTIALSAGANATVFSFVSALLLRPAPGVADPSSLIAIYTSDFSSGPYGTSSYPDYLSLKAKADAFSSMAAYQEGAVALIRIVDTVERVRGTAVSAEFFDVLGVRAAAGRLLEAADMAPGAPPTAVIGYDLWNRAFGLENSALGRTLVINGRHHTVVGVAPPRFDGLHLGAAFEL
ncbi:MAG: ABC transporter permease, partial [Acidobacteria bacterium]|nr:ABC transporter permease [Acidobacteriota bacterium]